MCRKILFPSPRINWVWKDGISPRSPTVLAGVIRAEEFAFFRKAVVDGDGGRCVGYGDGARKQEIAELSCLVGWLWTEGKQVLGDSAGTTGIDLVARKLRSAGYYNNDYGGR